MSARKLLYQEVSELIIDYILENEMHPGDRIPTEEELAKEFNVSRTSVREAVKTLAGVSILDIQQGRGIFVNDPELFPSVDKLVIKSKLGNSKIQELMDLRQVIEFGAVDLVIKNVQEKHLTKMEKVIKKMEILLEKDPKKFSYADMKFHLSFLETAGNNMLSEFGSILREFFVRYVETKEYKRTRTEIERSIGEHWEIYNAIKEKDVQRLEDSLRVHFIRRRTYLDTDIDKKD